MNINIQNYQIIGTLCYIALYFITYFYIKCLKHFGLTKYLVDNEDFGFLTKSLLSVFLYFLSLSIFEDKGISGLMYSFTAIVGIVSMVVVVNFILDKIGLGKYCGDETRKIGGGSNKSMNFVGSSSDRWLYRRR